MLTNFSESFGLNRTLSLMAVCLIGLVFGLGLFWFMHSAPPRVITLSSGLPGSSFDRNAQLYRDILKRNGVTLKILPSQGSLDNLHRLETRQADVGFVQGGIADGTNSGKLVSLGSLAYEPLLVFYRSTNAVRFLSDFAGQRLAVGAPGSGTRTLALALLQTNGIAPGDATRMLDLEAEAAARALLTGDVDVVFLMSDSASSETMRTLLRSPGVQLLSFEQADAYTRRYSYLNELRLPEGAIDLGKNLPSRDVRLIGPTVELVARQDLNPVASDLLIEAAQLVHGKAGMFQRLHEFPAPLQHGEYAVSPDAVRFYSKGKGFPYNTFPFWLASLISRMLVSLVPIALLIPGLRMIPAAYRWQMQLRIRRWYRKLIALERELVREMEPAKQAELLQRLDEIERAAKHLKMPASFADQFYNLRAHIDYVRLKLDRRPPP
jgi:TRAP-type uncharacterized transport system substrate-binding protein